MQAVVVAKENADDDEISDKAVCANRDEAAECG
jgi:hypothetical protein